MYQIVWDAKAKESLGGIVAYIKEESPDAARKVRLELLKLTASLEKMPHRFSVEPYLQHKGRVYRSVSKWSYKIIYRIGDREVRILQILHTRRDTTSMEEI